jgi:hypothetical protein
MLHWNDRWWLFTCDSPDEHDSLRLYHSGTLFSGWTEHVRSPLITGDCRSARPAGTLVTIGQRVIRYAQDCYPDYGTSVRAYEITHLSPNDYREDRLPYDPLSPAALSGWNSHGMHHVSAIFDEHLGWVAAVDGSELNGE